MAGTDIQGTGRSKLRWQLTLIVLLMGLLKLIVHMIIAGNYELHRDAYLYLNYADHPQWGYMSNPPFIMVMSWLAVKVFGGGVFVVRLFPALAGMITMIMLGRLVKELGGKKWAVIIATTAYLVSPIMLRSNSLYQPVAFDQMWWVLYLYFFVKLLQTHNKNYWFVLGLVAGLGFLTKYTIILPVALTTLFLGATRHRKLLFVPQIIGFFVNLALISFPNLIWQHNHNWPALSHFRKLQETQLVNVDSGWFLGMQVIMFAPALFIWLAGLYNLFTRKDSRQYIVVGYSFMGLILLMLLLHAKPYYPAAFYIILFVFGGIQWERWFAEKYKWVLWVAMVAMVAGTIPMLPLSLPYLNMDRMLAFSSKLQEKGMDGPFVWEDGEVHDLPQDYADMTGWQQLANTVREAYHTLPEDEQERCLIYGQNYGRVGAINYYNRKDKNFPTAFCFEGSFMFWTPTEAPTDLVLIYVATPDEFMFENFASIEKYATLNDPYFRENGTEIYICRNPIPEFRENYMALRKGVIEPNHRKSFEHSDE